jgi:hypothetical protein
MFHAWMRSDWESTVRGQKVFLPSKTVLTNLIRANKLGRQDTTILVKVISRGIQQT